MASMRATEPGTVEIIRDFLEAHDLTRALFDRNQNGELRFEQLAELIGDDERSVLYCLKERCHALFRPGPGDAGVPSHHEALVDLAVGSLFHEAMKFRENFYQREVYGPRVRELRSHAETGRDAKALFDEFEKILGGVSSRLEEGRQEVEALLAQTAEQLLLLLAAHPGSGLVTRHLRERKVQASQVFGRDFDELLALIHGSAAGGHAAAGSSYLGSGYYEAAIEAYEAAVERGGAREEIEPRIAYARGMSAYLARDYTECVSQLRRWAESRGDDPPTIVRLASEALSRIDQLVGDDAERARLAPELATLLPLVRREPAA